MTEGSINPKGIRVTVYLSNGQKEETDIEGIYDIDSIAFAIFSIFIKTNAKYISKPVVMMHYKIQIIDNNIITSKYLSMNTPSMENRNLAFETIINDCSTFCKANNIQTQHRLVRES